MTAIQSASSDQAEKDISLFLADHYSGVLSTASADGQPHGAVVYYLPDTDLSMYFVTKEETQKYKNIEQNKQVSFVVYDEKSQTTLEIQGKVEVVEDLETRRETLHNMTNSSIALSGTLLPPAYKIEAGDYVVLHLVPNSIQLAVYSRSADGQNIYESLQLS